MPPTHNSSSEVELEFCKRIIRNGLKQQKCQAYYTITRSGTAYFICSGPRQFLTGMVYGEQHPLVVISWDPLTPYVVQNPKWNYL